MIRALFWDSDNTVFDTAPLHWRKHAETLATLGITLPAEEEPRIRANNGAQNWEWLSAEYGLSMPKTEYLTKIDAWYEAHLHEVNFRPGVRLLMETLHKRRVPQAVVSNGRRDSVLKPYRQHGIAHLLKFFITIEDCTARKPDPDPYRKALIRMQDPTLEPSECLVIEDDPLGVESAHAVGMKVLHRKMTADQANAPQADRCVFEEKEFLSAVNQFCGFSK